MFNTASITTLSSGLAHLREKYLTNKALDQLMKNFNYRTVAQKESFPLGNGRTAVWYRYNLPGTSVNSITEGVGNSPQDTPGSRLIQATLSQFAEGLVLSDQVLETAPDQDILTQHANLLGYQAAYSADTMFRALLDAFSGSANMAPISTPGVLTGAFLKSFRTNMRALDIHPFDSGNFEGFIHPFSTYDLENDPQVLGYGDIFKYSQPDKLQSLKDNDGSTIITYANVRLRESTNTFVSTDGSGNPTYRAYFVGMGALGTIDLQGKEVTNVVNPRKQRFRVNVHRAPKEGTVYDPSGLLGGSAGYNFSTAGVVLDGDPGNGGGTLRFRTTDFVTTANG